MSVSADRQNTDTLDPRAKHAIRSAFLAYYVDLADIYLPILVLAPAIAYFVSPELSATGTAIVGASIFAVTLVGRPLGAGIFGHFGDTIGRKRTAMISMACSACATLLMALLPGYQVWGIAAVGLFILLRFLNGVFLGGQYTSANPLAMEYSPREKRGLYGAVINCGFPLAYVTIALLTLLLLSLMPSQGIESAYVQWGWRIPFLIIAAVEFGFAAYYYFAVSESELWTGEPEHTEAPIKTLLRGESLKSFLQVFVLMSGLWLALQSVSAILPGVLSGTVGLASTNVTITLIVAFSMLVPANIAAGVISQRIGRRTFLMAIGLIMLIVATPLYYLLISSAPQNFFVVILLATVIVMLVDSPFALTPSYINERFHTGVRSSGYGLGYSLAVILPSFYAFYQAGLATFMPFEYTVLVFVVVGGLLITVGAALGPETKDVDLSREVAESNQ